MDNDAADWTEEMRPLADALNNKITETHRAGFDILVGIHSVDIDGRSVNLVKATALRRVLTPDGTED
jgi:hypothetical protein